MSSTSKRSEQFRFCLQNDPQIMKQKTLLKNDQVNLSCLGGALIQGVWEALYKGIKGLFRCSQLEHQGII